MILRPVLMPVPGGADLPRSQRLSAQQRVARLAVDEAARLSGLPRAEWPQREDGAPLPSDGAYWSLSHKPAWTAGVVSDHPVGIDIERIAPRANALLFDKLASQTEWDLVSDRSWHNFFRLWTAKEATLKANGRGIGHLGKCALVAVHDQTTMTLSFEGREWAVNHFLHDEHLAAVAGSRTVVVWLVAPNPDPPPGP